MAYALWQFLSRLENEFREKAYGEFQIIKTQNYETKIENCSQNNSL